MKELAYASIAAAVIVAYIIVSQPTEAIPPTVAFSEVYVNGQPIKADRYNDKLYITTEGMITTTIQGKTVTMKLQEMSCPLLQGIKGIDANGNAICGAI